LRSCRDGQPLVGGRCALADDQQHSQRCQRPHHSAGASRLRLKDNLNDAYIWQLQLRAAERSILTTATTTLTVAALPLATAAIPLAAAALPIAASIRIAQLLSSGF